MRVMSSSSPQNDTAEQARRDKVSEVWSAEAARDAEVLGQYWLAHPLVRARVNRLASGRPDQDAYGRLAELLTARGWALPIPRALSLGCGFGALERDLLARGLVARFEALDLAEGAIAEARRLAAEAGLADRVRYHVADLEAADFAPGSVDVVFAHSSVHHVEALEALFDAVKRALRPGGVFHLHEFVGATRFQWTDAQLRLGNAMMDALPDRLRRLPDGSRKPALTRPTIDQMIAIDPSEAIRSADILPLIRAHFAVIEERPLGGALLHNVLGDLTQNFRPSSAEDCAVLERMFAAEDAAMADGSIGSDFATVTATVPDAPRRAWWRRALSSLLGRPAR
jgi:SAM-dependent methyltransferase